MKKLVLLLSFLFVMGLISVSAQEVKKTMKKEPSKTEKVVKKADEKKIETATTKDKPVVKKKKGKKVEKKAEPKK
jgi:hypothetical protein